VLAHLGIILAITATVVYNLGFIKEKQALDRLPPLDAHKIGRLIRTLFTSLGWLAGFLLICLGILLQLLVLALEPLSVAQPLQSTGVIVTVVFSRVMLHERLGRAELSCVAVIGVAAVLLGLSSGGGSGSAAGTHAAGAAVAAAAVPACLAFLILYSLASRASRRPPRHRAPRSHARHRASRVRRGVTGVSYGLGAGLIYGFSGVALKALSATIFGARHSAHTLIVLAITSPYLYVMLLTSAAGMVLFQVALQRSPASVVMPISLVMSTGYLVIAGSWLFHERLPASPGLLAMRLVGGLAAVSMPVIMTILSERRTAARVPHDLTNSDSRKEGAARPARPQPPRPRRDPYDHGYPADEPAGLPHRQAAAAVPGRMGAAVQPATAAQVSDP
jgi:drug/metabolite transporter (DMT)-like permease